MDTTKRRIARIEQHTAGASPRPALTVVVCREDSEDAKRDAVDRAIAAYVRANPHVPPSACSVTVIEALDKANAHDLRRLMGQA